MQNNPQSEFFLDIRLQKKKKKKRKKKSQIKLPSPFPLLPPPPLLSPLASSLTSPIAFIIPPKQTHNILPFFPPSLPSSLFSLSLSLSFSLTSPIAFIIPPKQTHKIPVRWWWSTPFPNWAIKCA